jgi:hypothetical protein
MSVSSENIHALQVPTRMLELAFRLRQRLAQSAQRDRTAMVQTR